MKRLKGGKLYEVGELVGKESLLMSGFELRKGSASVQKFYNTFGRWPDPKLDHNPMWLDYTVTDTPTLLPLAEIVEIERKIAYDVLGDTPEYAKFRRMAPQVFHRVRKLTAEAVACIRTSPLVGDSEKSTKIKDDALANLIATKVRADRELLHWIFHLKEEVCWELESLYLGNILLRVIAEEIQKNPLEFIREDPGEYVRDDWYPLPDAYYGFLRGIREMLDQEFHSLVEKISVRSVLDALKRASMVSVSGKHLLRPAHTARDYVTTLDPLAGSLPFSSTLFVFVGGGVPFSYPKGAYPGPEDWALRSLLATDEGDLATLSSASEGDAEVVVYSRGNRIVLVKKEMDVFHFLEETIQHVKEKTTLEKGKMTRGYTNRFRALSKKGKYHINPMPYWIAREGEDTRGREDEVPAASPEEGGASRASGSE